MNDPQPAAEPSAQEINDAIRAPYLSPDDLHITGKALGEATQADLPGHVPFDFTARQRSNERAILQAYRSTLAAVDSDEQITPAAEWLADNHYIVEKNIREVERDLPIRFYRQLPSIEVEGGGRMPCAMALAWLYAAHLHSTMSLEGLSALVEGYQEVRTLQIGELWALPSVLRFVLIENLRRIANRVERAREMRRLANETADRLLKEETSENCAPVLAEVAQHCAENPFVAQLLYRLRDGSQSVKEAVTWIERRLEARGTDVEEVLVSEHNRLASGNVTMGNIIQSLRKIDDIDWTEWFEEMSEVDRVLRGSTDFAALDFASRDLYRKAIEKMARRAGKKEIDVARAAIELAQQDGDATGGNIGFYLVGNRRPELERVIGYRPLPRQRLERGYAPFGWLCIAGPIAAFAIVVLALVAAFLARSGLAPTAIVILLVLFALPASEAASGLFNTLATLLLIPKRLVGYAYKTGIPESARTLVVVPCLIGSKDTIDELVRNLEVHYLATTQGEVYFALLSDWSDSTSEETAGDLAVLSYARDQVARLNALYSGEGDVARFHLLHRRRLYNPGEGRWMGWERKRGKLHELNRLLRGDPDTTFLPVENGLPESIRYVMTLDADTRLTRDAVTKLVGKMAHPVNAPLVDPATGTVMSGHGILQPRVTPSLTTGEEASAFQRIFSANRGLDPYVFTVSDVYQDLLGEGSFTGKGLYHVDAFEAAMDGRIPENAVLSHDLFEGALARCGLATDVELVEDFPTRYDIEMSRQHRWARGDWQLLPFIVSKSVPALGRWKMFDNLRRSSTPVAWLAASLLGWCLMPAGIATLWQAILILSLFVAPTLSLFLGALPRREDIVARAHLRSVISDTNATNAQVALRIVFLGHSAFVMADAIARTLYRVSVSRRHMLEWRTAAQATSSRYGIADYFRSMWQGPAVAAVALVLTAVIGSTGFFVALPFAFLWALSPAVAWFVSQSAETEDRLRLTEESADRLRQYARRTWRYFEDFTNEENNHLPPDNFQEDPEPVVAHRTSPTNIGIYLLSTVAARDFGWISLAETIERLERTVATIERMAKFRGHLYNWYDTRTLAPLMPRYVSSVDSGNLAGHLVAVSSACADWAGAPSAHLDAGIDGIADTAGILSDCLAAVADDRKTMRPLRRRIEERISGFHSAIETLRTQPEFASIRTINLTVLAREIQRLSVNLDHELHTAESGSLVNWAKALFTSCDAHVSDSMADPDVIEGLRKRMLALRTQTRDMAFSMDFAFLFREDRRLLSIGYRVEDGELDNSCYDLLASEARLTSLFGIAKGDLPTEHWFRLGRPVVPVGSRAALMSWSGSMFEYMMPPIVMQERPGGILHQSCVLAIRRQMSYARTLGTPWGISESAFYARDHDLNYQYSNFGVPSLGLKRGLGQNAVIAPYASLMATQYAPEEALANLERLTKLGALGRYGFHDAVDFTPTRVPAGARCAVVRNYMAHHHGMAITSVANVIFNGRLRERFHADPVIEAAELLLQEKAPREIPILTVKSDVEEAKTRQPTELHGPEIRTIADPVNSDRATVLLSNGRYSLMLTATGSGYARWKNLAVTRWTPDPTEDRAGNFIFLRDTETNAWWSATAEPKQAPGEIATTQFCDEKAVFSKTVGDIRSEVECIVATEGDGEGRKVTLYNDGDEDRLIEVTSYAELVLASEDADAAHPAFSKMFVQTEIGAGNDVIYAGRTQRDRNDPNFHVAHLVVSGGATGARRETQAETDRRAFVGRGRTLANAAAFEAGTRLSGSDGFTLDPILSLRRVVRVPSGKKTSLVFWTVAAPSRAEVAEAIDRYRYAESFQHELTRAWTRSQVEMRYVGVSSQEAATYQMLARHLIYPDLQLRPDPQKVRTGLAPQSALWPLSISGDFPIFALRINDEIDLEIVDRALRAQEFLRGRGLLADLVILNEKPSSYIQDLQNTIESKCENARLRGQVQGPRQHIFAVRRDLMAPETYNALIAAAHVVFHARNGKLNDQLARAHEPPEAPQALAARNAAAAGQGEGETAAETVAGVPATVSGDGLSFWNGYGGFSEDGRNYVIRLAGGAATPQPWINVIANENFGCHVSAEGAGFTWSRNSRDFQLTPWSNDPVINRPGEAIYVVDRDSAMVTSPFAGLSNNPAQRFEVRHALGSSTFETRCDDLTLELVQFVDAADPVKTSRLRLTNSGSGAKRLRLYGYAEWVLGSNRARTAPFIVPSMDADEVLSVRNHYSIDYAARTAFMACDRPLSSFTADRRAFIGRSGNIVRPESVVAGAELSRELGIDGDPCAALAVDLTIAPGATEEVAFLLGDADSEIAATALVKKHRSRDAAADLKMVDEHWHDFTDVLQVETPDEAMNLMVNAWLPYQALSCRLLARTAFYQASGAYGFRDQLQDTLAFLPHDSALARRQIVNAAGRQFVEGDVQHWWLPGSGAGVRTRIADDVVWLGYALCQYCNFTGDTAILDAELPFLEGPALQPEQHDAFFPPDKSEESASVYEHAARALDLAVARTGPHDLPLFLGGDWNDGMNRVGEGGKGESVWLGWFLLHTLNAFMPFAEKRNDTTRIVAWRAHADKLKTALEGPGWDGGYYRRGYFDDGTPLGSSESGECRIDSIAQSWSVLSGSYDAGRAGQAMDAVMSELVDRENDLVRLFTPPMSKTPLEPGYIKAYPPGVRENGGQYTHAATWVVCALAALGRGDDAYACFSMLNPVRHSEDRDAAERYRVEPYVVAADIYSTGVLAGRGGWTWYTGSAGWLYRAAVEGILGIHIRDGARLVVEPVLPAAWPGYTARLDFRGARCTIEVSRNEAGEVVVKIDGKLLVDPAKGVDLPVNGDFEAERRRKRMRLI